MTQITTTMTHEDIRNLLMGLAAAIELDQIRVDALPRDRFHPEYSDSMWRILRRSSLDSIHRLLPTVNAMPLTLLEELTQLSFAYDPRDVRETLVILFGGVVYPEEEVETAEKFFGCLIDDMDVKASSGTLMKRHASEQIMKWLFPLDPLRIAEDPECGYLLSGIGWRHPQET
jgi:hypothetical protein